MIKTVFRCQDNMVMVFDRRGEQIPEYQGQYEEVKECIFKDAPPDTIFSHAFWEGAKLKIVPRKEW